WFTGYTPQLSTSVMYVRGKGNEQLDGWLPSYFGGDFPADTWTAIMNKDMEGVPVEEFPLPAYVDGEAPEEGHQPTLPPAPTTNRTPSHTRDEPGKPTKPPHPPPPPPTSEPPTSEPPTTPPTTPPTETPTPTCPVLGCPTPTQPATATPTQRQGRAPVMPAQRNRLRW